MNGPEDLSKQALATVAIDATAGAAAATALTATVDMSGFDAVTFDVTFGAIVSGAVTSVKVGQGAASNGSDAVDVSGSSVTVADTDDNKLVRITLRKPTARYVTLTVSRATQNATLTAVASRYGSSKEPQTHSTTLVGSATVSVLG